MDTDYKEPYRTADVHEYVHLIINEVAPEYEPEFGYRYDIPSSEMSFVRNLPKMKFPFSHEDYIGNEPVIKSAEALGLDREKFWNVLPLLYLMKSCVCCEYSRCLYMWDWSQLIPLVIVGSGE